MRVPSVRTITPCCRRRATFQVASDQQTYRRRCRGCGVVWTVTRQTWYRLVGDGVKEQLTWSTADWRVIKTLTERTKRR